MIRRLCVMGFALCGSMVVGAAEVDHLEFARGLRGRNYSDLALQYLTELSVKPGLPPALARQLPFEMAKALLDLAAAETDPRVQKKLYDQTRQQLDAFIQANPNSPRAAEANLDRARILVQQAQARLHKARLEEGGARPAELKAVRTLFEQAGQSLRAATTQISAAAAKIESPALAQAKSDAELEIALNLIDQMVTFVGESEGDSDRRVAIGKKALDALKRLAALDDRNRVAWLARAALIRYYDEIDLLPDAGEMYKRFDRAAGPAVEPGKRLARWNYLRLLARKDPNHKDRNNTAEMLKLATEWLNDYRRFSRTPEGQGVRYELAQLYRHEADAVGNPKAPEALNKYLAAEKLYASLEQEESDYADRARIHKVQAMVKRKSELTDGDINKLATFEECFLRAQIESEKLNDEGRTPGADPKKAEAQRAKHIQNIVDVLERGLAKAGPKVRVKELIDARFLLEYYLLLAGKAEQAAELGEKLARGHPESVRAGAAGAYALHGLAQMIAEQEKAGASPEAIEAGRERLVKLAKYIEATWPGAVAADAARHQLGLLALRQGNYSEAIDALGRVTPQYAMYVQAQFQLGAAALQANERKAPRPEGQPPWEQQAAAAFRRVPEPPSANDPEGNRVYVAAKLELAKIQYAAKEFHEMETLLGGLAQRLNIEKDAAVQEEQKTAISKLTVYAKYGKADAEFRSGRAERHARTRELIDPLVDQLKAKQVPALDAKLVRAILGLALRANVLDGKPERAEEILAFLQSSAGEFENRSDILIGLVQQLRGQIEELKQKGPSFDAEREKTVAAFTAFLDRLAIKPESLTPEMIRFLAFSYSGLDKHALAAGLLEKIPPPKKPEDAKFYGETRVLHVHELRLAKKFAEADAALRAFLQTDAGKRSLGARKEEAALLEDQEKYAPAANAWFKLVDELKKLKDTNPQLNEPYHDCLYHYILCMYRFGAKSSDAATKRKYLERSARLVVSLERGDPQMGGLKERYQELLQAEAPLKAEYDAARAAESKVK